MPAWLALLIVMQPIIVIAVYGTRQVKDAERTRRITSVPPGWVAARGVVVDERTRATPGAHGQGGPPQLHQPVITFQSADGREFTFTSRLQAVTMPRPGALIGVYHDPADPSRACIAPESLPEVIAPMGTAARVVIGVIWALAALTVAVLGIVLFDI